MGCSVSRSCTVLTRTPRDSNGGSYSSVAVSSSYSAATPDRCSTAKSLPSPLVHHPPLKKGDTYHLVSLTSTTYGSLFLIEHKTPTFKVEEAPPPLLQSKDNEEDNSNGPPSPESVINTWELMDGLEDSDSNHNDSTKAISSIKNQQFSDLNESSCFDSDDRIVLYFTSLRGIRKTFKDCCFVRMTLRGFRVAVDERDISMNSSYRKQVQSALLGKATTLPQVFVRGKHIGGAEKIKQMNESGELGKLLEGFPVKDYRGACWKCGDARFVLCQNCSGSRKVFDEKLQGGRLRRCLDCNENGLKRCHLCCSFST